MASKNLGAVIQRAISDGAFRRQLQSDPAAALRGFNLTADEVAAIRSGDSSKLMSLGVDQRMSKAFSVSGSGMTGGAARASVSDLSAGGTASTIASDQTAGTREGIVGDPASSARAIHDSDPADLRGAVTTGDFAGNTRAVNDAAPFDSRSTVSDPTVAGTRAVNDSEPFAGNAVINDNQAAMNAGRGGSLTGDMSVASHMADAGDASAIRSINDVAPFEGNVNAADTDGNALLGGDARLDPGIDSSHADASSNTGETGNEHGWG
jgi:hypothetical protein